MSTQFPGTGKMIREKKQNPLVPMLQRGNAPGTLRVRLVERDALGIFLNFPRFTI